MTRVNMTVCAHRGGDRRCMINGNRFCSGKPCGVVCAKDCPAGEFAPRREEVR